MRGPDRPLPQPPHKGPETRSEQQFMGRKADCLIHCQGHVSQQRWHWVAQKLLPSGWS